MEHYEMKILMTTDPLGGVWNYALRLCRSLRAYGVQVHLASMGAPLTEGQKAGIASLKNVVLHESHYKLEWMQDPWDDVDQALEWLDGICKEVKPDLIHFNNYGQVDHEWPCPVLTVFHSCVLSWWWATKKEEPDTDQWYCYKHRVKNALYASDMVVAPTKSILAEAERIYGNLEHSACIYNGHEEVSFPEYHKEPIIFSMGRIWDESKNMKVLEELAKAVEWPIYIAGDNIDPVSKEAIRIENVHFLGKLCPKAVQDWLNRSAIYVQPSLYEPFGLSVLEAAQAGCMLVLNDISTFRELWRDAACFVNFSDRDILVERFNAIIENQYLRTCMSSSARNKARRYNEFRMAEEYLWLYEDLTKKSLQNKRASELIIEKI